MEKMQRELLSEFGSKADVVKQRKVFLKVVQKFRGRKLAPFPPRFAPYAEEWQQVVRITAVPRTIVDYLKAREGSIYEYEAVALNLDSKSSYEVLHEWGGKDAERQSYIESMMRLLQTFLFKSLLYKVELHPMAHHLLDSAAFDAAELARRCPIEYTVRLVTLIPQIVTAACDSILAKPADSEEIDSLVEFVNNHQSFLGYLEEHLSSLLQNPVVNPVDGPMGDEVKSDSRSLDGDEDDIKRIDRQRAKRTGDTRQRRKHKHRKPVKKFSREFNNTGIVAS
jgi:hypothetical protein